MRIAVAGAGAIGAYIGALLASQGEDVTLIARGPHLEAMRERGVRVEGDGDARVVPVKATGDLEEVGPVDVILLGVKAHGLPALAPRLGPLIGPDTAVVSTQNGIPWWFFPGGAVGDVRLESVDPDGRIAQAIEHRRILGSIVYFSTEIQSPGVIRHVEGNRLSLGEPDGSRSERSKRLAAVLNGAGLKCRVTVQIRNEIWVKLLGNVAFNPTSALTGATIGQMLEDPHARDLTRRMMEETAAVGARLGLELPVTVEQRMAGAAKMADHKTSMLQDLEAGRPLELEAVVGALVELAGRLDVPVPATRSIYACTRLLAERVKVQGVRR